MRPLARRLSLVAVISLGIAAGVLVGRQTAPAPPPAAPAVSIPVQVITKEIPVPAAPATLERVRKDSGLEGQLVCHTILKGGF